ncbi:MAG: PQQ-binding-like beta-propeller repeat protein [Thermoplasmata archaeon]
MEDIARYRISILAIAIALVIGSVIPGIAILGESSSATPHSAGDSETGDSETVVLVNVESSDDIDRLSDVGETIDQYGNYMLIRTTERIEDELAKEYDINRLENKNEINVKGHSFNTQEDIPTLNSEMHIEEYQPKTEGIYIVDMVGPVNPEWRDRLEKKGAEIINYVPNYAYEVSMTPKEADQVEEFEFVDWVGIYQPSYKLGPQVDQSIETDKPIKIRLNPGSDISTLRDMASEYEIIQYEDIKGQGRTLLIDIDSEEEVKELAMDNNVYYISTYNQPELHSEMDIQQIGGGQWFMDDEYETRTDLDPTPREGDPQNPYRNHGEYGAYINQLGYTGKENTIAVADTGIGDGTVGDAGVEDFTDRVIGGYGLGEDEDYWAGGHYHGTACTGLAAGDTYDGSGNTWDEYDDGDMPYYMGQGLASDSEIFAMKIFDDDGNSMIDEYYPIIEEVAQRSDAYVHSNSWGAGTHGTYVKADEVYDQGVRDADRETEGNQPMVITTSAGNDGWMGNETIGSPATAKNVITVGGNQPYNPGLDYENPENMYESSSRGWTKDNRVKPDVIAPSESVISQNTPLDDEGEYIAASGTSFGNPIVAGAASVVVDWYEQNYGVRPSPAMVKSILINTANELDPEKGDTRGHIPNKDEGWGVPDLSKLEYPTDDPLNFMFEDQTSLLNTGEEDEYKITYDDENKPMKITLSWTDDNAMDGDNEEGDPVLKNNLDLEVETPSGEVIRGNAFDLSGDGKSDDGFTYPEAEVMNDFDHNGDGYDDINNVENVYIPSENLETGIYTIRVVGKNIPADANNDGQPNQDYALTSQNSLFPEDGEFSMDSERYAEDDTIEFTVVDQDMFDQDTVDIQVNSTDQQGNLMDQMSVTLRGERRGVVTGSVDISPAFDENGEGLFVEDGFSIEASYFDQAMEDYKYDHAEVDGEPPEAPSDIEVAWSKQDEHNNNITWQLSGDDDSDQFDGYKIYRAESISGAPGAWEHIDTVDGGTEKYIDENTGKGDLTRYWYDIAAVDDVGNEKLSEDEVSEPPSVRVDSPKKDEIWTTGEEENIDWYATTGGSNGTVSIDYSTDSGENWTNIVEGLNANDGEGSYTWTVPQIQEIRNESLIRISIQDAEGNSHSTSENFVLTEYTPPDLEVTSPAENDRWYTNSNETIQWNTSLGDGETITSVTLEQSLDGGSTWTLISEKTEDNETYSWDVPEETSDQAIVKISIEDNNGLYAENISRQFDIIAAEPVENLSVDYRSLGEEILFQDSLEDGVAEPGYINSEKPDGVNIWDVRDHGAFSGEHSWDFGDSDYESSDGGSLSWLLSPEITIPADATEAHLTFQHWRDFDYRYDGGNMKISTDNQTWELIEPEEGYSNNISEEFDNPLAGEAAWTDMSRWDDVNFDLNEYVGETVRFNWSAGVDSWDSDEDGWRIDDIEVTAERPFSDDGDNTDNRLTWTASPDDGAGEDNVERYNIYRSDSEDDLGEYIDNITADGSTIYRYFDPDAGTSDNVTWSYSIRSVNTEGIEDHDGDSSQEPIGPYPQEEPNPGHESAIKLEQHETPELSFTAAHASSDTSMNITVYNAENDDIIGQVDGVYAGEVVTVGWDRLLTQGEHSWYVTVDDGNYVVESEKWSFLVDNSDPEVEITTPETKEKLNESTVTVTIDGDDDISGIDHYEARVRNVVSWTDIGKQTEIDIQNVPEGETIVDIRATDRAGNQMVDTVEFTVDTTAPTLEIRDPKTGSAFAKDQFTLEWVGDDVTTQIEKYEVRVNGGSWNDAGLSNSYKVAGLDEGDNVISVRATDKANNHRTSQIEVIYDPTDPNVNVTSLNEGDVLEEDEVELRWDGEVTWKDEESLSATEKYEVRMDNQGWIDYDYEEPDPPAEGGDLDWRHSKHDDYVYSVYESNGVVYSGSWDDTVMAYDPENEEVLWQHDHHDDSIGYVVESNGTVFSGSYDGTVVAADAEDGSIIWQHDHHDGAVYSVDTSDGVVYSGSGDSTVIAADAEDGSMIWQHEHHSSGNGVFSVHESNGVIYSGSIIDNLVVAADAETGEFIWQHSHHEGMVYSVYESNGVVYSGGDGGWGSPGQVFAADAETGELLWMHEHHDDTPSQVYSVHAANGIVYSGSEDGTVLAVDADDGSIIWQHDHHDAFVYSVFESNGMLYSGSGDETVAAVHAEDGEPAPRPELSHTFTGLEDGEHTAYIRTTNAAGNQYTETINFTVDTIEPQINITEPSDSLEELTYDEEFTIHGTVSNAEKIYVDGDEIALTNDSFNYSVLLTEGYNEFTIVAEDDSQNRVVKSVSALYLPDIPELWNEIETLHNEVNAIQEDISSIEGDIQVIQDQLTDIEEDITSLENELETVDKDIDDIQQNITVIEEDLDSVEKNISDLQENQDDIKNEQENQADDISLARNLGIGGVLLAIIALALAIVTMTRGKSTEKESFEEETPPENEGDTLMDEDTFGDEEEPETELD